ncbi:ARID DNA-binding domain-containing protein [Tanacetum coccineum]
MVHSNMLKNNWLGKKPVKHWYQSHGSDHGRRPRPIDEEEVTSRFLQRETPQKGSEYSKKSLSPGCKEMLLKRMKEVEAFNASKETREHGEDSRTQKEKRARCYKCKIRGHVYWKCPNKDKEELNWNWMFLSFMDLLKKDSLVYKNWEIFSRKFVEMIKWFYLVYLNYERLDEIPPRVGWKIVAGCLTEDDGEAMRDCYKKFIDMVQVYYETTERPWYDRKPGKEVGESSRAGANGEDPQGKDKGKAGIEEAQENGLIIKTQFGVKLESNIEEDAEQGSITDSNDFEIIV